jgi:DNA-binding transcriptional ArsR family regulator
MNESRTAGVEALKALGHPLRARLFNLLSVYGAATATDLGKRIGESSGSTSYHLRQLEKHGLVMEDTERGTARERYWQRIPGPVEIGSPEVTSTPAGLSAVQMASSALNQVEEQLVRDFINYRSEELPEEWQRASDDSSAYLWLTAEQTARLGAEVHAVMERFRAEAAEVPGAARVFLKYRVFPVALENEPEPDLLTRPIEVIGQSPIDLGSATGAEPTPQTDSAIGSPEPINSPEEEQP